MPEATYRQCGDSVDYTPTAAVVAGQIVQLPDGRAGFAHTAIAAGALGSVQVEGIVEAEKTTSMVVLNGSELFWDASANKAHLLHRNDADFPIGCAIEDEASAATTVKVDLNRKQAFTATLGNGFVGVPINTAGFPFIDGVGDGVNLGFSATAEAQKVDALSHRGFAVGTKCIVEALVCVNTNGDASAVDINVGLANATHATDADSITESLFLHIDGASTNIALESDDGTTEVAATDTTVDFTAGTPFLVQWDIRDNTDIQVYVDGVNVLPSSVFKLNAATGPLKLLAHMEKTSDDSPGNVSVLKLGYRTFDASDNY